MSNNSILKMYPESGLPTPNMFVSLIAKTVLLCLHLVHMEIVLDAFLTVAFPREGVFAKCGPICGACLSFLEYATTLSD